MRTQRLRPAIFLLLPLGFIPRGPKPELQLVLALSQVILAGYTVVQEHVVDIAEVLVVLPESASLRGTQVQPQTDQYDVAVRVKSAKDEVGEVVLELLGLDLKAGLESPVRLLDPCPAVSAKRLTSFAPSSHWQDHSLSPLYGSEIFPAFFSSTWTDVGTLQSCQSS